MAILPILEAPHPVLSKKARRVEPGEFGPGLAQLLEDMAETMYAAPGVGLAAPQVGDGRRILVADPGFQDEDGETRKGIHILKMVNPEIVERSTDFIDWEESCLSVPEYSLDVRRSRRIRVTWQDEAGAPREQVFEDFAAVVMQHEMDHLEGVTLLERSSRLRRSRYLSRARKARGPDALPAR